MKIKTVTVLGFCCLFAVSLVVLGKFEPVYSNSTIAQSNSCYPTDTLQRDNPYPPICSFAECLNANTYGTLYKEQTWSVFFPGDSNGQQTTTYGSGTCNGMSGIYHCWPAFLTPVKSNRLWKQTVLKGIIAEARIDRSDPNFPYCTIVCGWGYSRTFETRPLDSNCGSSGNQACSQTTGSYCFASSNGATCSQGTVAIPPCCCFWSPIAFDLTGNGFSFTDIAGGVRFDLEGSGTAYQVAWPTASSGNAWLALDRNGNGLIDNGKELFGNFTQQPLGQGEGNGFLALAEYDKPANGGDGDGSIASNDSVFSSLRLWRDANHNGISESSELLTLQSQGILWIALAYVETPITDQYGNKFKFQGKAQTASGKKVIYDIAPQFTP